MSCLVELRDIKLKSGPTTWGVTEGRSKKGGPELGSCSRHITEPPRTHQQSKVFSRRRADPHRQTWPSQQEKQYLSHRRVNPP
jgi:hypothetical protein